MKRSGYIGLSVFTVVLVIAAVVYARYPFQQESIARKISSITPDETMISADAHGLVSELGKVDSATSLDQFISKHSGRLEAVVNSNNITSLPADYRLIAAVLYPLKGLRGAGHRLFGLSKARPGTFFADVKRNFIVRNILLSKMQGAASHINTYFPKFGADLFDWLTTPYRGIGTDFSTYSDLQNFFLGEIYTSLQKSIQVIDTIQITNETPLVIDSAIFTGPNVSVPHENRYLYLFPHSLAVLKAMMHQFSHNIIINSAYSKDDLFAYQAKLQTKLLSPGLPLSMPGMPGVKAAKILKSFPRLYKLRAIPFKTPEGNKRWFNRALYHLRQQIQLEREAVSTVKLANDLISGEMARLSFVNPKLGAYLGERTDRNMSKREELVNSTQVTMRHWITGDLVTVNFLGFYQNPPRDLKAFLPTKFDTKTHRKLKADGKRYYNYRYGMAQGWNLSSWNTYFPSVSSNDDVKTVVNVLRSNNETNLSSRVIGRFVTMAANFKVFNLLSL